MIPIRDSYAKMLELGSLTTSRMAVTELTKKMRKVVGTDEIRLFTKRDSKVDKNDIVIGGLYDPFEDQAGLPSVSIYVTYSPKQKTIRFQDIDWPSISLCVVECIGHELVHQEQYRARDFDLGPTFFVSAKEDKALRENQEYLGSTDEIEAYGYSIAAEIFLKECPEKISGKNVVKTALYKSYVEAFGANHIVVRHLLENVLKYYKRFITIEGVVNVQQISNSRV